MTSSFCNDKYANITKQTRLCRYALGLNNISFLKIKDNYQRNTFHTIFLPFQILFVPLKT